VRQQESIPGLPDLNLQPGELYLARSPTILRTILGSCVGVTFWSPRLRIGALCHGILPRCPQGWLPEVDPSEEYRYVDASIRHLVRQFVALGASRQELVIKVFGGADVLQVGWAVQDRPTIGAMNCLSAEEALESEGLAIFASDVRGTRGRRISFDTATGVVLLHRLGAGTGRK